MSNTIEQMYEQLMNGFTPDKSVETVWPMKDGMYLQYSAYETNDICLSGTSDSIRSL